MFLIETAFGTFPLSSRNDSFSSALQNTESSMTESHKVEEVPSFANSSRFGEDDLRTSDLERERLLISA